MELIWEVHSAQFVPVWELPNRSATKDPIVLSPPCMFLHAPKISQLSQISLPASVPIPRLRELVGLPPAPLAKRGQSPAKPLSRPRLSNRSRLQPRASFRVFLQSAGAASNRAKPRQYLVKPRQMSSKPHPVSSTRQVSGQTASNLVKPRQASAGPVDFRRRDISAASVVGGGHARAAQAV